MGRYAGVVFAHHFFSGVRAQRQPAFDLAQSVWLDGFVRLCARRVFTQPPVGLCARSPRVGLVELGHYLATRLAQQHDTGGHVFAVSHECSHFGPDQSGLFRLGCAARHPQLG